MQIKTHTDLLYGKSTAPGRIRAYYENRAAGYNDLLPYSCKLRVYANDLAYELSRTSKDLRWGAGVKLVLDNYKAPAPIKPKKWYFVLDDDHPDFDKLTEHQKQFLWDGDYTGEIIHGINVGDFMEGEADTTESRVSIEDSWATMWEVLHDEYVDYVVVNLNDLRPNGSQNGRGLTSTGPVGDGTEESNTASFLAIYEHIAIYAHNPSITNFIRLFGVLNNTIRRGGLYKNGIVCSSLWWEHPDIKEYLSIPLVSIAGSHKKSVGISAAVLDDTPLLKLIQEKVRDESVFLEKRKANAEAYPNVCVSGNTWIDTTKGPKQVKDLVGVPFNTFVNGEIHSSTDRGFWSNGLRETVTLSTQSGLQLNLTPDHKVIKAEREGYDKPWKETWVEVQHLVPGDRVKLAANCYEWEGDGTFNQGWLVGNLIGDGFFTSDKAANLQFIGEGRNELIEIAHSILLEEPSVYRQGSNVPYPMTPSSDLTAAHHQLPHRTIGGRVLGNLALKWGLTRDFKHNLSTVENKASSDFCRGLVRGLFDADTGNTEGSGKSIQFTQVAESVVRPLVRILHRLGITTNTYIKPAKTTEIHGQAYDCKPSFRVDITGQANLQRYADVIGFYHPDKVAKLEMLLSTYAKSTYSPSSYTKVVSVESSDDCEVYDCTIPSLGYFSANGLIAHNCVGLAVPDDGTCLIWRVNFGMCEEPEDIVEAYKQTAFSLTSLHLSWRDDNPEKAKYSAPLEQDRQIGLDVMGLANYLAIHDITYQQFVNAVELFFCDESDSLEFIEKLAGETNRQALDLVRAIVKGQEEAIKVCDQLTDEAGLPRLARIFCVEPAQSHSYETFDLKGRTTCRGIWPPVGRRVNFQSSTRPNRTVMHGKVETVTSVSKELYEAIHEAYQRLLDLSGRGHYISYDLRQEPTEEWFTHFLLDSTLKTKYYTEIASTDQTYLNKEIKEVKP